MQTWHCCILRDNSPFCSINLDLSTWSFEPVLFTKLIKSTIMNNRPCILWGGALAHQ